MVPLSSHGNACSVCARRAGAVAAGSGRSVMVRSGWPSPRPVLQRSVVDASSVSGMAAVASHATRWLSVGCRVKLTVVGRGLQWHASMGGALDG